MNINLSNEVKYIGVDDMELDLFESQYVIPDGMCYNSYLILDEKVAIMDTADHRKEDEWFANLKEQLGDREPDYLIVHHMEPDHSGSIVRLLEAYPNLTVVGNAKTFQLYRQFFGNGLDGHTLEVKDGENLSLGGRTLTFYTAPMVHWPEVMFSYDDKDKILFSADAFGKFGAIDAEDDEGWACEARRYYFNIVGKYGMQVQAILKKVGEKEIAMICPLHGPVLSGDLSQYLDLYRTWSSYEAESHGVFIAYASIHGNTRKAAKTLAKMLEEKGCARVRMADLSREDIAECVEDAFRHDRVVFASASYDAGVFPPMADFLHHLATKAYQNRTVGLVENGSWAPSAAKTMRGILEGMKNITILDPTVSIRSSLKEENMPQLEALADALMELE